MCNASAIGALAGSAMNYYGMKKGGAATQDVYDQEQANQARLRANNLSSAVAATEKNVPTAIAPVAPAVSSADDVKSLAGAVGGSGTDSAQFSGQVSRGANASAMQVDDTARHAAILRAFGLSGQADMLEKQRAQQLIDSNNLESQNALALLPQRLRAAGAQGAKWRMAGSALTGVSGGAAGMT